MSKIYTLIFFTLIVAIGPGSICIAEESGTAFTYQGRLLDDNMAADGLFDFQFMLYDDPNFPYGYQVGEAIVINDLEVIEGYFTAVLDFGDDPGIFDGDGRWLQIGVRDGPSEDTDVYTIMEPRQQIMPTPYAYHSFSAGGTTSPSGGSNYWGNVGNDINYMDGNVGIGTATPAAELDVAGTTRTQILEITGGADMAEPFDVDGAESVRPGMVVCIDADNPGQLKLSGKAYDRTVAGIVSGANGVNAGLTMRQEGTIADGSLPVALTGRVYCWCDATAGAINPGDLLTTSNTPGHAMKVTGHSKSAGAIIGKAMSKLENGKGLVLVLVSLQ